MARDGAYYAYNHGGDGIVEATPANLEEVKELIQKAQDASENLKDNSYVPGRIIPTMFLSCETVMVAVYDGFVPVDNDTNKVRAIFRQSERLKGAPFGGHVPIQVDRVRNGSKMENAFDLPEENSEWILFLEQSIAINKMFQTYRGAKGRIPSTVENRAIIDATIRILEDSDDRIGNLVRNCETILIAQCSGIGPSRNDPNIEVAIYYCIERLKGAPIGRSIELPTSTTDRPRKGSEWILFFPSAIEQAHVVEATPTNFAAVHIILNKLIEGKQKGGP